MNSHINLYFLFKGIVLGFAIAAPVGQIGILCIRRSSTFFLTITNPMTILAFIGAFAALGVGREGYPDLYNAALLVIGVFLGSTLWWLILSNLVGRLHKRLNTQTLKWINRGLGIIIMIYIFGYYKKVV